MLMSREHKDAGKLTRQLFRWARDISAEVAWPLFLGAMARIMTTSQDKGRPMKFLDLKLLIQYVS
jgi:hypothetical protein